MVNTVCAFPKAEADAMQIPMVLAWPATTLQRPFAIILRTAKFENRRRTLSHA